MAASTHDKSLNWSRTGFELSHPASANANRVISELSPVEARVDQTQSIAADSIVIPALPFIVPASLRWSL